MTHHDIFSTPYRADFILKVDQPHTPPNLDAKGFKIWHVEDGFICRPVQRSSKVGESLFVFPYFAHTGLCYFCSFTDFKPYKRRVKSGSGTVTLFGNKTPTRLTNAAYLVYKALTLSIQIYESKDRADKVNIINYATKRISEIYGVVPACVYHDDVYCLSRSKFGLEYRLIGYKVDLSRVSVYIMDNNEDLIFERFGFTTEAYMKLLSDTVDNYRNEVKLRAFRAKLSTQ